MLALRTGRSLSPTLITMLSGTMLAAVVVLGTTTGAHAQPGDNRLAAAAARPGVDPMPIRRITLYRSGVGYFLRAGKVQGTERVQLHFDAAQINDVLKSLQVLDRSGGRVDAVSYSSKDPLSRRLGSFALQIGDNPSLSTLLERLRGSPVSLVTIDGQVSGEVLSVETRKVPAPGAKPGDDAAIVDTPFVNLLTDAGIQSVAITQIRSFKIDDEGLAKDLNKALSALAESRAERIKNVDLQLSGTGERDIAVAYVHETPVWKTSYRLVLPEGESGTPEGSKSVLQGWAIVENTTDNDWQNVSLALVSGRPVSFQMDLYEPLYLFRPMIPVPTVPGVMPKTFESGMQFAGVAEGRPMSTMAPAAPPPMAAPGGIAGRARGAGGGAAKNMRDGAPAGDEAGESYAMSAADMVDYAAKPVAQGGEVGEQFQFELEAPVTIERQRSAMIPLLASPIGGKRVSIYNQSDRADHPMRGVQLTNDTNLQLLPGPISVYDGPAYAGDAQINQIGVGDKRLLAYAVDLDVTVTTTPIDASATTKLRIVRGTFELTVKRESGTKYTFANKDLKRGRELIVEHPRFAAWELTSPAKPEGDAAAGIEQTQSLYRFPLSVAAGKQAELTVRQERVEKQTVGIDSYSMETLMRFSQDGKVSDGVLQAVREMQRKQSALSDAERAVQQTDQQLQTLKQDQTRITNMLSSLDRQTDAYKNLLAKVNTQEKAIDGLNTQREQQGRTVEQLRADLNAYVSGLSVE